MFYPFICGRLCNNISTENTDEPFSDSAIMAYGSSFSFYILVCFDAWWRQLRIFCGEIYLWTSNNYIVFFYLFMAHPVVL